MMMTTVGLHRSNFFSVQLSNAQQVAIFPLWLVDYSSLRLISDNDRMGKTAPLKRAEYIQLFPPLQCEHVSAHSGTSPL